MSKLIEINRNDLQIDKVYYFDDAFQSYGIFKIRGEKELFFKPIKNTIYDVENGLVSFINNNKLDGFYLKETK